MSMHRRDAAVAVDVQETCLRIDDFYEMFDLDVQEMLGGKVRFDDEEDEELEDFDPILKMELEEFEKTCSSMTFQKSDPDLDLLEIEYLINNPGATFLDGRSSFEEKLEDSNSMSKKELAELDKLNPHMKREISDSSLGENCQGTYHDPFDLFSLTCRGKKNILQEFDYVESDTSWSEFKMKELDVRRYDDRGDEGILFSEAREWHDAWVKRNKMLDVEEEALIFGVHYGCKSKEEIVLFGNHVGKKGERNLDLHMKA